MDGYLAPMIWHVFRFFVRQSLIHKTRVVKSMLIQNLSLSYILGFNRHGMALLSVFDVRHFWHVPLKCYFLNHRV